MLAWNLCTPHVDWVVLRSHVCFGCHGLYDVDDDIASSTRSSLKALIEDLDVEESDISIIRDFYNQYRKSYETLLCWDCALFRVLGYTEKYDDKRNG